MNERNIKKSMNNNDKAFAKALATHKIDMDINDDEVLADMIGISRSALMRHKRDTSSMTLENFRRYVKICGFTSEEVYKIVGGRA